MSLSTASLTAGGPSAAGPGLRRRRRRRSRRSPVSRPSRSAGRWYGSRPRSCRAVLAVAAVAVVAPGLLAGADPLAADPLHALAGAERRALVRHRPPRPRRASPGSCTAPRHSLSIGVAAILLAAAAGVLLGVAGRAVPRLRRRGCSAARSTSLSAFPRTAARAAGHRHHRARHRQRDPRDRHRADPATTPG